jgi:hypothetical protein
MPPREPLSTDDVNLNGVDGCSGLRRSRPDSFGRIIPISVAQSAVAPGFQDVTASDQWTAI